MRRCTADKKDFWSVYPYLPKETRGYLPGFIAATYVMNNYKHHNISPALAKRPIITDSVHVNRRIYFQQIADVLQMPVEEIKVLNPQYRQGCIPGDIRPYSLVLPSNQIYSYILSEDAISNHNADLYARRYTVEPASAATAAENAEGEWVTTEKVIYHKVKRNESMSKIAKHYGVSLSSLRRANGNIRSPKRGQKLKVVTTQRVFRPAPKEETPEETPQQMPETNDVQLADASTGADGSEATEAAEQAALAFEQAMWRTELHRALGVCDAFLRTANKRWSDASKAAKAVQKDDQAAGDALMHQALVDAFLELRVATVLMHGIVPAGCELICEHFDIAPEAFFSWEHVLDSTDALVESLGEKPGTHRVKELPPRFDFFSY